MPHKCLLSEKAHQARTAACPVSQLIGQVPKYWTVLSSTTLAPITRSKHLSTNFILVDFENVQPDLLSAVEQAKFSVIVFVGASQTKIPFEIADALQQLSLIHI